MRVLSIIIIVASLIGVGFASKTNSPDINNDTKELTGSYAPVVVLELFTSEGCSSCPPADRLLPELAKLDTNIIPLSFHVDYWNRLGWEDPFSSGEYSSRQREYANYWLLESVYTPELVINGEYELVGSNKREAESAVKKALLKNSQIGIKIGHVYTGRGKVRFTCKSEGEWNKTDLVAVLVQKKAVMNVRAGENRGATLSHMNVVRSFEKRKTEGSTEFSLGIPDGLSESDWFLVAFAQQKKDLKITGAAKYDLH